MATDRAFKWSGFVKGFSDSMAQAMQRRLEQRYKEEERPQPVDLLSYLPDPVRESLFPGRSSLLVDPSNVSSMLGHLTTVYGHVSKPQQATLPGAFVSDLVRAVQTGDWTQWEQKYGQTEIPAEDFYRVFGALTPVATSERTFAESKDIKEQLAWEDTPLTEEYAAMLGMPQWAGMTPRQIHGLLNIRGGIREEEAHEDARLMAALERAAKALGIEATQQELQQSAAMFESLLRQEKARADLMEFEAQKAPEQYELITKRILQEIENLAAQGKLTSLQVKLLSQALPDLLRQEAAKADTMEAEARRAQIEADLLAEFGRQREQMALRAAELGIALDEATLDRTLRTTEAVVAKAVAEASLAQTEAQTQEALAPIVIEQAKAELESRYLQNQIASAEYEAMLQLLPIQVEQALENLRTSRVRRQAEELQLELAKEFDRRFKIESLKSLELNNLRQAVGLELDQAELERYVRLTDPIVQKAVAEAAVADIEALFRQDTFDTMVAKVEAELQAQLIANKINEHEYELALKIAPYRVQQAAEEVLKIQLQNEAAEWQLQLSKAFDEKYMIEGLKKLELENLRQAVGLQMDQAELERFVKLTDPIVQKAVAEAAVADIEALFKQSTFDTMVAQVEAELQAQLIANKISEQEYELALKLAPYRVQQAVEELLSLQLQNEARELENQYARDTLPQRIQLVSEQLQNLKLEQQHTEVKIRELRRQIAMARRTEPLLVAQLEAELENIKLRNQQLAIQIAQLEQRAEAYQGLDADDRDFAFKLYQAENELFRGQNVWIPPFADYVTNMMSESPLDWNTYVMLYDEEMRQSVGPPPEGDALDFPWMSQEWQNLYKKELDNYIATLPDSQWRLRQAPLFPSMAVFYGNYMSPNPMTMPELVERYNKGTIPQYIYEIAFGRPVNVTGTSKGRMDELISDLPNIFPDLSSNEDILSVLQSGHPAIQSLMEKIEEIYGVTGDELIAELRRR